MSIEDKKFMSQVSAAVLGAEIQRRDVTPEQLKEILANGERMSDLSQMVADTVSDNLESLEHFARQDMKNGHVRAINRVVSVCFDWHEAADKFNGAIQALLDLPVTKGKKPPEGPEDQNFN